MTMISAPDRLTPDDLLRVPDNAAMELVDGQIVEKDVSEESSLIEQWIGTRLTTFVMRNPIARVYSSSLGYQVFQHVPGDRDRIRKPDVSVIRLERVRSLPRVNPGYMPIVPDLAVEVLSPNDTAHEVAEKLRL